MAYSPEQTLPVACETHKQTNTHANTYTYTHAHTEISKTESPTFMVRESNTARIDNVSRENVYVNCLSTSPCS